MAKLKKFIPLIILIVILILFFAFDLQRFISLSTLQTYHHTLIDWTSQHTVLAALVFMLVYIVSTAISIPGATILTLIGGLLFGPLFGSIFVVVSAAIGACVPFLATKTALYDFFHAKAGKTLGKLEAGFKHNAVSYLLFLRLVPLFPFWLVNIAPAFFGIRLRTFFWTTLIGIIPGSVVYVAVGNGIGTVLDKGESVNLGIIFHPAVLLPLIGLAILSLVPIVYKMLKKGKQRGDTQN